MEKNTSLLIVAGFSFADEHIAKITLRAANSNPTLQVLVFAYDNNAKEKIISNLNNVGTQINNNILIIDPESFVQVQEEEMLDTFKDLKVFDLESLNKYVFRGIELLIK